MGMLVGAQHYPSNYQTTKHATESAKQQEPWLTKDAAGFFTFLLVIVGSFQVVLFVWQLWLIRKSLHDAKEAADAAQGAARAAERQAKVSEDTLANIQRPYIYVFGVDQFITSDDLPAITPYVESSVANYGQTPAVIEIANVGFFSGQIPEIPLRVDFGHDFVISPV